MTPTRRAALGLIGGVFAAPVLAATPPRFRVDASRIAAAGAPGFARAIEVRMARAGEKLSWWSHL